MKNKVDRRDLSQLRNEVDLLSLRLEELGACDPGAIGQMQSVLQRQEDSPISVQTGNCSLSATS